MDIKLLVYAYCANIIMIHLVIESRNRVQLMVNNLKGKKSICYAVCRMGDTKEVNLKAFDAAETLIDSLEQVKSYSELDAILTQLASVAMNLGNKKGLNIVKDQWYKFQENDVLNNYKESGFLREIMNYGVDNAFYEIVESLFHEDKVEYLRIEARPKCLLDALKKRDYKMVDILLDGLKKIENYRFVCDDVFKECVRIDHIECAQAVVEQGWYNPTKADCELAAKYYGAVYVWLLQRMEGLISV